MNATTLAKAIGQTKSALSRQFNGHQRIDLEQAGRIAKALNVHLVELLQDEPLQRRSDPPEYDEAERAIEILARRAGVKIRIERKKS